MYIKVLHILRECIPVFLMVALIPFIHNDYVLASVYVIIAAVLMFGIRRKFDVLVYGVGLVAMTVFEYIFIMTGVEIFGRTTLLGVMPLWLPFLWAYGFVVMKRSIVILIADEK